jgi:hypothetical protein
MTNELVNQCLTKRKKKISINNKSTYDDISEEKEKEDRERSKGKSLKAYGKGLEK